MKKMIIKYIAVGLGVLVILAFAIYFALGGQGSTGQTRVPRNTDQNKEKVSLFDNKEDAVTVDDMPEIPDIPEVGDVVRTQGVDIEGDVVTWSSSRYVDKEAQPGENNYEVFVLHNASDYDADLYVDIYYEYSSKDPQVNTICVNNVPAGGDACVWTVTDDYVSCDVSVNARSPQPDCATIMDQLDVNYTDHGDGITAVVTNNSNYDARYLDAIVLFRKGGDIVNMRHCTLYTEQDSLPPKEAQEFSVPGNGKKYDDVEIYLTGYGQM